MGGAGNKIINVATWSSPLALLCTHTPPLLPLPTFPSHPSPPPLPQSPYGEGRKKVEAAAKAAGLFTPPLVDKVEVEEHLEASVEKIHEALRNLFNSGEVRARADETR